MRHPSTCLAAIATTLLAAGKNAPNLWFGMTARLVQYGGAPGIFSGVMVLDYLSRRMERELRTGERVYFGCILQAFTEARLADR